MKQFFLVLMMAVMLSSCKESLEMEPPENLIDETIYIDMYVELHLFNALVEAVDTVKNQDSLKTKLFAKYAVPEEDFRASHSYYQSQTQLQQARLDTAIARLAKALEELNRPRIIEPNQLRNSNQDIRPEN